MTDLLSHPPVAALLGRLADIPPGWVWLAGAGPGEEGLITVQLLAALVSADVVVHDALVNQQTLELIPARTLKQFAGKRGGKASASQQDISTSLVAHARQGRRVLRLKGGDPMVFGRGAEEAQALVEAGVPFRILPGVTSGIAAPTYAGIPLTHREYSSSVTLITGHIASGDLPEIDWRALASGADTLVFFMAMTHAAQISTRLIEAGLSPNRPTALICSATLPEQQQRRGRLSELGAMADALAPPSIIVIGEVVKLADTLDWLKAARMEHM